MIDNNLILGRICQIYRFILISINSTNNQIVQILSHRRLFYKVFGSYDTEMFSNKPLTMLLQMNSSIQIVVEQLMNEHSSLKTKRHLHFNHMFLEIYSFKENQETVSIVINQKFMAFTSLGKNKRKGRLHKHQSNSNLMVLSQWVLYRL